MEFLAKVAVYDLSYQTYTGPRRGPVHRWLAIARFAWVEMLSRRVFAILFTLAWLQFIVRLALIYVLNTPLLKSMGFEALIGPLNEAISIDAAFFKSMIDWQLPFCFMFVFILGAGAISRDLAHNAIILYIVKPIGRYEYLLGKFATLFLLLLALSWLQTMALYFAQVLLAPETSAWRTEFWSQYFWLIFPITLYSVLLSASLSLLVLAFSSTARSGRYAGIAFLIYLIGAHTVIALLAELIGAIGPIQAHDWFGLSPLAIGYALGDWLFSQQAEVRPAAAWFGLALHWLVAGAILKWRLDGAARQGN